MSKTTITLLIILLIFLGVLLFIVFGTKQSAILTSLTQTSPTPTTTSDTTLSFSTNTQIVQPGQTVTVAVLIHNPHPHPSVVQLEIAYDPAAVTIENVIPGSFFTHPSIPLKNIDPIGGRISYALRCPLIPSTNKETDCINPNSSTVATITLQVNPYAIASTTSLTLFPKTVIRTASGKDIKKKTSGLVFTINKPLYPYASSSGIASPGANYLHVTPAH